MRNKYDIVLKSTIILIEDNTADNYLHSILLEETGKVGKIITAYDGEEAFKALEQLSQRPPSGKCLILLDINMPVMNGWEFLELYENKPHLHQTNDGIFILTGSINPEDKKKAERHSYVSGFIEKPLDTQSLAEILFPD